MEDTNEIVTKLYAIRAGMCVLVGEKEKSDAILAQAKSAYDAKIKEADGKLRAMQSEVDDVKSDLYESERRERVNKSFRNELFINFLKTVLWGLVSLILFSVLLALAGATLYLLVCVVGSLIIYLFNVDSGWFVIYEWYVNWLESLSGWGVALLFLAPIVFGGLTVAYGFLLYYLFIDEEIITDRLKDSMSDFSTSCSAIFRARGLSRRHRRAEKSAEYAKYAFESAENRYRDEEQKIKAELAEARRKADIIITNAMVFYSALEKLYGNFLRVQDWRNVDYIIYSFDSGRAESMKEALQLADREEQTQRIVETMQEITRKICNAIKYNADRIQDNLNRNFKMISDKVTEESARICGYINEVGVKIDKVNANLQNIQIAQSVQTAYLANISSQANLANQMRKREAETSSQLASTVGLLRDDYRRVNSLN